MGGDAAGSASAGSAIDSAVDQYEVSEDAEGTGMVPDTTLEGEGGYMDFGGASVVDSILDMHAQAAQGHDPPANDPDDPTEADTDADTMAIKSAKATKSGASDTEAT